jgi:CubicO group peptidase (beta-lactamase class C family)
LSVGAEDLVTMRLGFGFVSEADCAAVSAAALAGLGIGPPDPSVPLGPDVWIERFAKLPLLEQPGTVWRHDLAYAVLGVVLARAGGRPLDDLLRDRLFGPTGMSDTAFVAPSGRLPPSFAAGGTELVVFDPAVRSRWSVPPSFPGARGGLVSTAGDLLRFAGARIDGGQGIISPATVTAIIASGKVEFVYALNARSGALMWKTPVGEHNGHDNDSALALAHQLTIKLPYTISPGSLGGVLSNIAVAGGSVYVTTLDLPITFTTLNSADGSKAGGPKSGDEVQQGPIIVTMARSLIRVDGS